MNAMVETFDDRLERSLHTLESSLEGAAEARAKAEELEEKKKQVLATMVVHYRNEGCGIGEAEHQARASKPYKDAADEWAMANYAYRKTDAQAEARRIAFEAWRTKSATQRAAMNLR
jgi:hypothetical protein